MLKRILGLLGWLGVALVFAAVAIKFSKPEWQQYYYGLAIAGLVCTLLYILSQWREVGQAFAGRQARFGTLAIVSVLVVLAILVAINYLGTRHNKRWDLTAAKQFSLSDQTRKVLQDLKQPVHVRVFARSDDFERFRDRLDEYTYASKNVTVEYIDPEKKPALAQQFGITALGTVVFEYAGRNEKATSEGEQELTNALIKVIQGKQPKVYFTQGHGEKDTTSADRTGYNSISAALTSDNFVVDKVVLAQQTAVPADADVLIIAGPHTDFLAPEIDMLVTILERVYRNPRNRDAFISTLPIAGKDGTIEKRMRMTRAENNVTAKTGSIANVRCLSGFVRTRDDEVLAFSILANNFTAPAATVNWITDLAVEKLAEFSRK